MGGGGAVALSRRYGPDRRDTDLGEADRLRDDSAERGRGAGSAARGASTRLSAGGRTHWVDRPGLHAAAIRRLCEVRQEMSRWHVENPRAAPSLAMNTATMGRTASRRSVMAKYLLLKHYRGAPAAVNDVPMEQWTPEELSAHVQYMRDFAARLEGTGEFVDG